MVLPEHEQRAQEVLAQAAELFKFSPDWLTFYREVLGPKGCARQAFPAQDQYTEFEKTQAYQEIQQMILQLQQRGASNPPQEPTTVITVRLPKSLHEALKAEAHEKRTSMNKLCIAKLLQALESGELSPLDLETEESSAATLGGSGYPFERA